MRDCRRRVGKFLCVRRAQRQQKTQGRWEDRSWIGLMKNPGTCWADPRTLSRELPKGVVETPCSVFRTGGVG